MAEIKSLLKLTEETRAKDLPIINSINNEISLEIDSVMASEIEYKVEYNIGTSLLVCDGPLQKERIRTIVMDGLKAKGYRASMQDEDILLITWTINNLSVSAT